MKYRKLGGTGIKVSVICQGCWSLISDDFNWGHNELKDSIEAIHASLDRGINFFDTAEGYGQGESEQILGQALKGQRSEAIVASKAARGNLNREAIFAACDNSLRNLNTDYIDLDQIHWPNPEIPLAETIGAMEELKTAGKIRALGVSNFGLDYLNELAAIGRVESNQLCYNLLWRAIEHEVQPKCIEQNISILCYSSLGQGLLTGKYNTPEEIPEKRARTRLFPDSRPHTRHGEKGCQEQAFQALDEIRSIAAETGEDMGTLSLAWLLAQPGVTSVIVGGRNAGQARCNAAACEVNISPAVAEALAKATEPVKRYIGNNCDMWQSDSRMERPRR